MRAEVQGKMGRGSGARDRFPSKFHEAHAAKRGGSLIPGIVQTNPSRLSSGVTHNRGHRGRWSIALSGFRDFQAQKPSFSRAFRVQQPHAPAGRADVRQLGWLPTAQ